MVRAEGLREGLIIRLGKDFYKVIFSVTHKGTATMASMVHSKLRNLQTGTIEERRFASDEKIDDLLVKKIIMQYLYSNEIAHVFMNPETFEQIALNKKTLGQRGAYLIENMTIPVELYEEQALDVIFPKVVEIKVTSTGAGLKGKAESTYKEATLENGVVIMVPQFIKTGDIIHVEVETNRYLERVREKS